MYGPTAATRPRVPGAGWGEGGPLALFSYKKEAIREVSNVRHVAILLLFHEEFLSHQKLFE